MPFPFWQVIDAFIRELITRVSRFGQVIDAFNKELITRVVAELREAVSRVKLPMPSETLDARARDEVRRSPRRMHYTLHPIEFQPTPSPPQPHPYQ